MEKPHKQITGDKTFDAPRFVQNSFAVSFDRDFKIRRRANEFEDFLKSGKGYGVPHILPVSDEIDPAAPRLVFGSSQGFSQILVSQIGITLNVSYSPDWQKDIEKGAEYLKERCSLLYDLVDILGERRVFFCGLTTRVQVPFSGDENEMFEFLGRTFLSKERNESLHDMGVKTTTVVENKFFSNISVYNYRLWGDDKFHSAITRLSRKTSYEKGVEIVSDFNDRHSYNENVDYFSKRTLLNVIIEKGISEIKLVLNGFHGTGEVS